jgi:putative FmdB family regulatory protein
MPLYEYLCDACGYRFERIQKFSDPLADVCPKCGSTVHKLMSSPAIQFKGSGFYITDYAKKDHVAAEKADSAPGAASASSDSKDSAKTESKSETKSETKSESSSAATPAPSGPASSDKS